MAKAPTIKLEAEGNFPFQFFIEKAVPMSKDGDDLILEGIASTTNIDHDSERMSADALRAMEAAINEKGVPLRVEHNKEDTAIIGKVFKGWVDDRNQLHIQAVLDKTHAVAPVLYQAMKDGAKMGLSVGGVVKRAAREFAESLGKIVKTFYDVELQEVSVTPRPANYDSWLVAKSIKAPGESAEPYRKSGFYNEFLFENPKLDYLQAFAKSIPDEAWHKVNTLNNMKVHKAEEEERETEDTEKAVSRREFDSLKSQINKGFKAITQLISKTEEMDTDPKDAVNPDEDKTTDIGEEAVKAETDEEEEKEKAEDETEEEKEEAEDETEEDETKEKSEETEADGDDLEGEREKKSRKARKARKAEDKEDEKEGDDTYDLKDTEIERTIKSMEKLSKKLSKAEDEKEEDETEKADDEEDEEETKEKSMHSLDRLVLQIAKNMSLLAGKMEKSGTRIPGFEKSIINTLRDDKEFQTELAKHMKIPGVKQSMSMGNVYVPTKEGQRLQLNMSAPRDTIAKSEKTGGSFKEVFKTNFSSVSSQEE